MTGDTQSGHEPRRMRTLAVMALAGLAAGFPAGWLMNKVGKAQGLGRLPWSDDGALTLAGTFLVAGLLVLLLSTNRRGQAILANPSEPAFGARVTPPQVAFFRLQGCVLILAGAMLGAPVIAGLIDGEAIAADRATLMAAIVASFALQSALNFLLWRRADEVFRQVMAETGALCFWLMQGALFLWACGVKLHVLREISSWDAVTVLMAVYLLMSTFVGYRRGLG